MRVSLCTCITDAVRGDEILGTAFTLRKRLTILLTSVLDTSDNQRLILQPHSLTVPSTRTVLRQYTRVRNVGRVTKGGILLRA